MGSSFAKKFLEQTGEIARQINPNDVESMVSGIRELQTRQGRLFCIGSGGGAGHASHATCDFRKLCGIEAYCPTDNVSELTARINDDGWASSLAGYLKVSRISKNDAVLVFSVGGGDAAKNISPNLVEAVTFARSVGADVFGIVGRDGGFTKRHAKACIVIPSPDPALVTPHTEGFQAIAWHLLISHPDLQIRKAKWESEVTTP